MLNARLLDEIRAANMSYLLLAQQLIRDDRSEAMVRLGISEDTANLIEQLTTTQVVRIASNNVLMCSLRFEDEHVWQLLCSHGKDRSLTGMHAAILMAGKSTEPME